MTTLKDDKSTLHPDAVKAAKAVYALAKGNTAREKHIKALGAVPCPPPTIEEGVIELAVIITRECGLMKRDNLIEELVGGMVLMGAAGSKVFEQLVTEARELMAEDAK